MRLQEGFLCSAQHRGWSHSLQGHWSPSPGLLRPQDSHLLLPCIRLCAPSQGSCRPCCAVESQLLAGCGQASPGVRPVGSLPGVLQALVSASGSLGKGFCLGPLLGQNETRCHSGLTVASLHPRS